MREAAAPGANEAALPATDSAVEQHRHENAQAAAELQSSSAAVLVIELQPTHAEAADLGEVLARVQGVNVRREGGLGATTRLSLDGSLIERAFIDGVPIEAAGFPMQLTQLSTNLFERADIYRGVVPIRLATSAHGGTIDLVTRYTDAPGVRASYQFGSFGIHRATVEGRYRDATSGLITGGTAFVDVAQNDYESEQSLADTSGRLTNQHVRRFHDAYAGYGLRLHVGLVERAWADRLSLEGFVGSYDKELQHNAGGTVPYGEVEYGDTVLGATARYEVGRDSTVSLSIVGSYAHHVYDYSDAAIWNYNWRGERTQQRAMPGETEFGSYRARYDVIFARATGQWQLAREHALRLSIAPQAETGELGTGGISASMLTVVSGLEYAADLLEHVLSNSVFVKHYYTRFGGDGRATPTRSPEPLAGTHHALGAGDALCLRPIPWLGIKASYEYATRTPLVSEVLGDSKLVLASLELSPELSHNLNLGAQLDLKDTPLGTFSADANAYLRDSTNQIVAVGSDRFFQYRNLLHSRTLGLDTGLAWNSPARFASLGGTLSWQDARNVSDDSAFSNFKGDRLPNKPYFYASWSARVRIAHLPAARDTLEPYYYGRYVHGYGVGWESQGLNDLQRRVPSQVIHTLGLTWNFGGAFGRASATVEVSNLTDAQVYDVLAVQRPGRAFYVKLTAEM